MNIKSNTLIFIILLSLSCTQAYVEEKMLEKGAASDIEEVDKFGPAQNYEEQINPFIRDFDKDGLPNYLDPDDDNDGYFDEEDKHQYFYDD